MPVDFIQERKKQKYLVITLVIIFIIAGFILWFGYFRKEKTLPASVSGFTPVEVKINFEVLENAFLKESQSFEEAHPFEGEKGRSNPFIPY